MLFCFLYCDRAIFPSPQPGPVSAVGLAHTPAAPRQRVARVSDKTASLLIIGLSFARAPPDQQELPRRDQRLVASLARTGWWVIASCSASTIAAGEPSPAWINARYRSCVMAKNSAWCSAGTPISVASRSEERRVGKESRCGRLSKLIRENTFGFSSAKNFLSLVQAEVQKEIARDR